MTPNNASAVPEGRPSDADIETLLKEQEQLEQETAPRVPFRPYDIVVLAIFVALFAVVFLQFFTRYALNDSIAWTEEMARYLLIVMTFVGAIKCQLIDSHIRLEVIDKIAGKWLPALKLMSQVLVLGFSVFCSWSIWVLIKKTSFQSMISLPFPKYYFYAFILAALVVLSCVCAIQLVALVRKSSK